MFEIIKGCNFSTYFGIMPVKIIDMTRDTDLSDNVDEMRVCEISIKEDDVEMFLYHFL